MSRRTEKVAATIRRSLQDLLARGLQDPRMKGLVTITSVRVTEDLSTAFIGISVMPEQHERVTMQGLQAAAGFLRREVGKALSTRKLPALQFQLDRSIKREAEVLAALERVRQERESHTDEPEASAQEGSEP